MPRKSSFTKEQVVAKALQIVRTKGIEGLTARSLGAALGSSSSPIFTLFDNMDDVVQALNVAAGRLFDDYVADVADFTPAFKEFGMRQMRFARQEPNLFHFLFLRKDAVGLDVQPRLRECLQGIREGYGFSEEQVDMLLQQMWIYLCGLAALSAHAPDCYPDEVVSELLSCQFNAMIVFLKSGKKVINMDPHRRADGEVNILKV